MPDSKTDQFKSVSLTAVLGMEITALLAALGGFAYLGGFTRYLADDYCETVLAGSGSILHALLVRYQTVSDRYSNLLFDGLSEFLLPRRIQFVPVIMILLWTLALIWLVHEIKLSTGLHWPLTADIFLGALLSFFSILEAPSRFQTIYWRSAMATHFAPLVYLAGLSALALFQIRRMPSGRPAVWIGPLFLVGAFIGGGFSEPPDAMLIVGSALALAAVVIWEKGPRRRAAISIAAWTLAGGLLALLVMALAPGNSYRITSPRPGPLILVEHTLVYVLQFIGDSISTLPLPSLLSFGMPLLLFYYLWSGVPRLDSSSRRELAITMIVTPILMYCLISASFAPSVYGQSFPEARARFAGRLIWIAALMLEGACLGVALAQLKTLWQSAGGYLALGLLAIASLYPLHAIGGALDQSLPAYSQWASNWDLRQSQILAAKAAGGQDLVVPQLPGLEQVKELDTQSNYWVNICAAQFYGVHSISAPPMGRP